jgi:hypothetical protein
MFDSQYRVSTVSFDAQRGHINGIVGDLCRCDQSTEPDGDSRREVNVRMTITLLPGPARPRLCRDRPLARTRPS